MGETTEVRIGRIGRPHGLRGQVTITVHTDEPERRFAAGQKMRSADGRQAFTVKSHHWHHGQLLLSLVGVEDRTAAEGLRGTELVASVAMSESAAGADEYWDRQLIGLIVHDHRRQRVGLVAAVNHLPGQDLLEIDLDAGGEALVPLVAALVPEVDPTAGLVVLADVPGLLDPLGS